MHRHNYTADRIKGIVGLLRQCVVILELNFFLDNFKCQCTIMPTVYINVNFKIPNI